MKLLYGIFYINDRGHLQLYGGMYESDRGLITELKKLPSGLYSVIPVYKVENVNETDPVVANGGVIVEPDPGAQEVSQSGKPKLYSGEEKKEDNTQQ